eukprot:7391724-Prymnesium_polylepis.2
MELMSRATATGIVSRRMQHRKARKLRVVSQLEAVAQSIPKLLVHSLHDERRATDSAHVEVAAPVEGRARATAREENVGG